MKLEKDSVHIWRYRVAETDYFIEEVDVVLSKEEKQRASDFIFDSDRIRFVTVHRFLRKVLSRYTSLQPKDLMFERNEFNKPFLSNPEKGSCVNFNLSYRGEYALLAVSADSEPGIDIEQIRPIDDVKAFSSQYFSEKESKTICKAKGNEQLSVLFTFWAFKEAYVKALGIGFSRDLRIFDLSDFITKPTNILKYGTKGKWTIEKIDSPDGYISAIAIGSEKFNMSEFNYSDLEK